MVAQGKRMNGVNECRPGVYMPPSTPGGASGAAKKGMAIHAPQSGCFRF